MAGSGTGIFALGGTLLVLDFFVIFGGAGGAPSYLREALQWVLLLSGLVLGGVGIWRILHSRPHFGERRGGEQGAPGAGARGASWVPEHQAPPWISPVTLL